MPILFNRVLTFAAFPFLALIGLAFLCVRVALSACLRLAGWELAWPPVLADGLDEDNQPRLVPPGSSAASTLPRTAMTRVNLSRL